MNACVLLICISAHLPADLAPVPTADAPPPVATARETAGPRRFERPGSILSALADTGRAARPARRRERQPEPDRFFAEDKYKHFFTSFIVTSLAASGARAAGASDRSSMWIGAAAGFGVGVAKEVRDIGRETETASFLDLVWDAGGVGAATVLQAQSRR